MHIIIVFAYKKYFLIVDGYWLVWSGWSECNRTCGGALRIRTRECKEPLYEGTTCVGVNEEKEDCNTEPCAGN